MTVFYVISKYATVFGTLIKGLWEHISCGILKIFVEDARYLEPTELCGHVEHEMPKDRAKAFLVCFIPTIVNALLAFFLGGAGFMGLFNLGVQKSSPVFWLYVVLYYLGVSFFCNMFPLVEDAMNNWDRIYQSALTDEDKAKNEEIKKSSDKGEKIKKEANIFTKILLFIPSAIMYGGAFLEKYCGTFIISIIVTVLAIFLA